MVHINRLLYKYYGRITIANLYGLIITPCSKKLGKQLWDDMCHGHHGRW